MFKFQWKYFVLAILLFLAEVLIAYYMHDKIIRPYVGDLLVVILIYCFIKSFVNISVTKAAIFVLLFVYVIELLQYLNMIKFLGLQKSRMANIVLGNYFEWIDLVAYTAGIAIVILIEKRIAYLNKSLNTE